MSTLPSVMVVDDEEELAHLFTELLKGSGFDCVSFTDPLQALNHFSSNPQMYSLVLTDLRMPGLNGIDLAKRLKEYSPTVKIILISAFIDDNHLDNHDELKEATTITKVIHKPIKLKELRTHVNNLCFNC